MLNNKIKNIEETIKKTHNIDEIVSLLEEIFPNYTIVDLSDSFEKNPTFEDVKEYISTIINNGMKYATLSPDWFIDVVGNSDKKRHVIKSSIYAKMSNAQRNRHNKYVMVLEQLIANAVYIDDRLNDKEDKKPNIEKYHYFHTYVKINDKIYIIKLVAEEYKGDSTEKPQTVHLYDILEKK